MSNKEAKMSSTKTKEDTPPIPKEKPKKRSLIERELETSLTPRLTSPLQKNGEGVTTSRYGRARRLKNDMDFCDTEKAVSKVLQSPSLTRLPTKSPLAYKTHAPNNQEKIESPKKFLSCSLDNQIENIYNANISLSRFGSDEKKVQSSPSPNQKFSKIYIRKDLIQTKEKEETVTMIKNIFSPVKSAKKPNSHLNNILERSSEKYNIYSSKSGSKVKSITKPQNGYLDTASVVKTLDFDSKKKKKKDGGEIKQVLSKNELFELEATSPYQAGDLAWARVGTFPFWPCIVTREPGSDMFVKKKLFGLVEHYIIHVTFFADNGRRSWIIDNMLRSYRGLDEFESAREQFTPEAKKKDPKLYSAFFISDKKLVLWHTSIEEADSLQREPKRFRIDLLNEILMNPQRIKLTPPEIQVPRSGRITNRNDSDVSLSESLYDTLFSEGDGKNETPRKQRNKSLDVSQVVTACLDNMAAKTGITKIQRQSHMDIWLQKAKSKTPEKSQFSINITVERVDEKEKPKRDNSNGSRRKKWVPPREPLHKPYSFRKSTETRNLHLLAYQNEHDYSNLNAEPTNNQNGQNSMQNTNENASGTATPPICVIDQVVSLKEFENEILTTEVHDDLITDIMVQQDVESEKQDQIIQKDPANEETGLEKTDSQIIQETTSSVKESIEKQTDFQGDEESEKLLQEIDEVLSDRPKPGDVTLEKETVACESPTFTQPINELTWADEQDIVDQSETLPDEQQTPAKSVEKDTLTNELDTITQSVEKEIVENEPETIILSVRKENNESEPPTIIKPVEEDTLEKSQVFTQSVEKNTVENEPDVVTKSIEKEIVAYETQTISKSVEREIVTKEQQPVIQLINDHESDDDQNIDDYDSEYSEPSPEYERLDEIMDQEKNTSSDPRAKASNENASGTMKSIELESPKSMVEKNNTLANKPRDKSTLFESNSDLNMSLDNSMTSSGNHLVSEPRHMPIDEIIKITDLATPAKSKDSTTDSDKTSCNTNLVLDSTRLTPVADLKDIMEVTEELVTPKKTGVATFPLDNDRISRSTHHDSDLKIQTPAYKCTENKVDSEELISLNDILDTKQMNDYVNELKETEKKLKRKDKLNKTSNEVYSDEIITTVEHDEGSAENRIVTRASKAKKNELKEKHVTSKVSEVGKVRETTQTVKDNIPKVRETTMNDPVSNKKSPKVTKVKETMNNSISKKSRSEHVTETTTNANLPENISVTSELEPVKLPKVKIADIYVANSTIVLNGLDNLSDKQDVVTTEDSICDTYSLRSELSSLNMCGDDTNDKDFDPETISLSSLSSVVSEPSVVAPRRLTRKTSFHEGRLKCVAKNKDMDRIRRELLQDSDNESVSSLEDVALSELKTRSKDNTKNLRESIDSGKSDTSEKQLKVLVTDCMSRLKGKLPKVKEVSSETNVEYEIVDSPKTESFGSRKRISLRLKKTSPSKVENVLNTEQKDSRKPKTLFTEEKAISIEAQIFNANSEKTRRKSRPSSSKPTAEHKTDILKDKLESQEKSLQSLKTEAEIVDLTDLPLVARLKNPFVTKSLKLMLSPLKIKSVAEPLSSTEGLEKGSLTPKRKSRTIRLRKSSSSHPKSSPESRYPKRKSVYSETQSTSSLEVSNTLSQKSFTKRNSIPNQLESRFAGAKTNNKHETSNSMPPEPIVNGFHDSRPSSPDIELKEPELDTISVKSTDSVSSTKRKGKGKAEHERMKEPEFLQYLELRQDTLMDEHPELTYEEIVVYLYKTWQYEESRKSDIKKTDELENANLVKGVNELVCTPKHKQKPKRDRLININKVLNKVSPKKFDTSNLLPRELPKRKASKPFYKEEFSDIEDEIEMFEIFKKKPKSTTPQVEPKQEILITEPKQEVEVTDNVKKEISSPETKTETKVEVTPLPVIVSTKSELTKTEAKEELEIPDEDEIEEYYDQEELYFEHLTKPKPNVFKGMIREKVCEICEKTSDLVKCKGCNGMFHVDCVKKVDEPVEVIAPTRGRKKKKKPRGRKPKSSLDSTEEGNSDEKYQDQNASEENVSFEDVKDIEPIVIIDVDNFETQLEAKMKEMIDATVEYDSYSSDDGIDWSESVAGKCEIIDVKLKPRTQPVLDADFKCKNCQEHGSPICFVCKTAVSPRDKVDRRQRCHVAHCHKYYHLECLEHWPQTQFNAGELSRNNKNNEELSEALTCPRHVCHTCVCDDPRGCKTRFSGDKLARCVRCPATYHSFTKCLPAGSEILSASHIVCPRHYKHRPGKVPFHVNTGWCFICAVGGNLICCDFCPTSFHADCLNIEPPEGGYMCEDCETGRLPLYGEMVWVKLGHYRWWPGIVLHPTEIPENIMAVKHSPGEFVVRFFGQYDHYWVNRGRVFPFQEGDSGKVSAQKSKIDEAFTIAMEHAQRAFEILKNVEPNDEENQDIQSSLLPPHYVKLRVNKPCGALYGRKIDIEESSLTQCECNPDEEEPCGPYSHCLNRMLLTECGPTCRAGERCQNRQFEKRQYPKLVPYRTPHRGWGLKTLEDIKAGEFVIEYVGELIDVAEFRRRMRRKHEIRDENFYFLTLDKERMIDAGPKGNLARFMNHCCEPNCETQKWTVLGDVRVGLFAIDDIPANTEVTFNYNLECTGIEKKQCMCGAKRCAGYIGAKPKQEDPQPKKLKLPTKRVYKKRKNIDSPSTSNNPSTSNSSNKSSKPKRPIGRPPKPKEPRELTEIEKDLLIIKNATNGLSSDSETSARRDSADLDTDKLDKIHKIEKIPLKRKRVSFSTEDNVVLYNGVTSPTNKKIRLDEQQNSVGD